MRNQLRPAVVAFVMLNLITGVIYPAIATAVARVAFPSRSRGSLILVDGRAVGSELIGQPFSDPKYFWSRPSATSPAPYNAAASSGSNLSPTNPVQLEAVKQRIAALHEADPGNLKPVPIDLVTASGSGLDPHISIAAAQYQLERVARVRKLPVPEVEALVREYREGRTMGVLGDERVNVLKLNLALDSRVQ